MDSYLNYIPESRPTCRNRHPTRVQLLPYRQGFAVTGTGLELGLLSFPVNTFCTTMSVWFCQNALSCNNLMLRNFARDAAQRRYGIMLWFCITRYNHTSNLVFVSTCWVSKPQFRASIWGSLVNCRDWRVGVNFWQLSHHAGVIFSGLKLRARTLVNGTSSATKGKSCIQPRVRMHAFG